MMQAGHLGLLLLATLAAAVSAAEPGNIFRAAKDMDSFYMDSEEEPFKRAVELTKAPKEHEKTVVKEEFEVEVPVKDEVLVKVPVEAPSSKCPYSVELKLSVPKSKTPIKPHIETFPVLEHHSHGKKETSHCAPCKEKLHPFHFSHPHKTEFIESAPILTEFKSPFEGHFFEEEMYVPEVHPFSKFHPYPYMNFGKSHPTKVIVIEEKHIPYEEEHIVKAHHPSHFYYPKHIPTFVEEPISWKHSPYEKHSVFKTHPMTIYHPKPIIIEEPVVIDKHVNKHHYHHHHHHEGKKH